ncbi:hypothetical protein SULYE_1039 [Sulfurihydrogenibium yellowstonense SS-5]|uniref:Uncharacterized protein n=1 Tax=Sulfurihydrogenibium yellowstonense SS-5 TaxID=432331 RepID=C4FKD9_9AQUI|nr:hypothetical protein SULYE_1039 [Sulfurihydrogenibium yellowstonense SS-5]
MFELYNPHGSDVTEAVKFFEPHYFILYNPHGSDVTHSTNSFGEAVIGFITHTVQM